MQSKFLQSSGLNNYFIGTGLSFQDYIRQMQTIITRARLDLTSVNADKIVQANSPFEWRPIFPAGTPTKRKNGILVIHGLFDSPFNMMDVGRYFLNKDFLIRGILLPGHGTVPGDLLCVDYGEWIKAVKYGIETLAQEVENVYVIAYSLGATLAIYSALNSTQVKALVLFAPALKSHKRAAAYLHLYKLICWAIPSANWYAVHPQTSYVKYQSFACNAGVQAYRLIKLTQILLRQKSLQIPIFTVASASDETVCTHTTMEFFLHQPNPNNYLIIYSSSPLQNKLENKNAVFLQSVAANRNSAIEIRNSYFPDQKILDFSHTCLTISPTNCYYGVNSSYKDFLHYPNGLPPRHQDILLGAAIERNLKEHVIQRLSYNPDFDYLMKKLELFLQAVA